MVLKVVKSNTELVKLLKKGDMVAFDTIYERYFNRLYGFVFRYVKQKVDVEGIVQEVFIKIWETRSKIDVHSSFEYFIFTIAYNLTISLLRKRVIENKYVDHIKSLQQVKNADDILEDIHFKALEGKVQLLLNQLTPRQKQIFQLSREDGLSHREIAGKLNISVNTVKNHMVSTLSFLKRKIDKALIVSVLFVYLYL